ncbi:hypothetical protein K2P47_04845 [Patescibacteria group bacterium]|nr:hypothetical protein [Patescibacteria group bacterium]
MSEALSNSNEKFKGDLENLQVRLGKILDFKLDVDIITNADARLEFFLDEVVNVVESIRDVYAKQNPEVVNIQQQEEEALRGLGFEGVEAVLDKINTVKKLLTDTITNILETQIPDVITPPASGAEIQQGSGNGFEKNTQLIPRLKMLLFILINDCNVSGDNINVRRGSVSEAMMRSEPYVSVNVPELNRVIIVCDEYGNRTDIFDTANLAFQTEGLDHIEAMTKEEKNQYGMKNPGAHTTLLFRKNWSEYLHTYLSNDLPKDSKALKLVERPKTFDTTPRLNKDGFWYDETGEKWGTAKAIGFNITGRGGLHLQSSFKEFLNGADSRIAVSHAVTPKIYKLSEATEFVLNDPELSVFLRKANEQGEWIDSEGNKWGSLVAILFQLTGKVWLARQKDFIEAIATLPKNKILSGTNKIEALKFSDVKAIIENNPEFSVNERAVGEDGFYIDAEGNKWGSKLKISEEISGRSALYHNQEFSELLNGLQTQKIKGGVSSIKAYSLTDVKEAVRKHPSLSRFISQ